MSAKKQKKEHLISSGAWLLIGLFFGLLCLLGGETDSLFLMGLGMAGFCIGMFIPFYRTFSVSDDDGSFFFFFLLKTRRIENVIAYGC